MRNISMSHCEDEVSFESITTVDSFVLYDVLSSTNLSHKLNLPVLLLA